MDNTFKEVKDFAGIYEMYDVYKHCMYMPTEEKYKLKVKTWLQDENIKIYAYFDNEKIKGTIVVLLQNCQNAEIIGISVDSSSRGQGIGSYMIQRIKEKYNIDKLYAETDDEANLFYAKNDFKITEHIEIYNGQKVIRYHCVLET